MTVIDLTATYGIDCDTYYDEVVIGNDYSSTWKITGRDFTDYVGSCHWQDKTWDDVTATVVISSNNGITPQNLDVPNLSAEYTTTISSADTSALTVGQFYYADLLLDNGSTEKKTALRIRLKIRGRATI